MAESQLLSQLPVVAASLSLWRQVKPIMGPLSCGCPMCCVLCLGLNKTLVNSWIAFILCFHSGCVSKAGFSLSLITRHIVSFVSKVLFPIEKIIFLFHFICGKHLSFLDCRLTLLQQHGLVTSEIWMRSGLPFRRKWYIWNTAYALLSGDPLTSVT